MRLIFVLGFSALLAVVLTGCRAEPEPVEPVKDYDAPLPPGRLALRKITDPRQIPDFTLACTFTFGLRESIERSLNYLGKPSSKTYFPAGDVTHERVVAGLEAFLTLLDSRPSPQALNAEIRKKFDVYISVGCDDRGTVLFTGYYTPIFDASPTRTEKFKYPLYKMPAGLEKLPDGSPAKPMPTRRAIEESGIYAGNELVWLAHPFDVFVVHVQGSARLRMPDGSEEMVGYAANNGHDYKSIRAELIRDKKIGSGAGLPSMRAYFRAHPGMVNEYLRRNPRFVFFGFVRGGTALGCLNEPVTAMRSIATDKKIFPRASLAFISTTLPRHLGGRIVNVRYTGFACDQDAGGAIRAPGRCDVYMGRGEKAGQLAGRAKNEGKLYYLFLKE
ncbi:MAG: MltA domain-containing protein [Planctomycetota bacterium]